MARIWSARWIVAAAALLGCSDSGGSSSNLPMDALPDVEGCGPASSYQDRRDDSATRVVSWTFNVGPERCMRVRPGQTVTFSGELGMHPISATSPAGAASPFSTRVGGVVTFPAPGLFGYECSLHPFGMRGAIWVSP
jgi:plastocyanin